MQIIVALVVSGVIPKINYLLGSGLHVPPRLLFVFAVDPVVVAIILEALWF